MKPIYEPKGAAKEYGDYALNIYTGCPHRCFYCVSKDSPILMADGTTKAIGDIEVGDLIIGVKKRVGYYFLTEAAVLAKSTSVKRAYRIRLSDSTEIICSADHRWLTQRRGWKYTIGKMNGKERRPYLTTNNELLGYGDSICHVTTETTDNYKRGYLRGIVVGDGTVGHYHYEAGDIHSFRLAMQDAAAVKRSKEYLEYFGFKPASFTFKNPNGTEMPAIRLSGKKVSDVESLIHVAEEDMSDREFLRGYMAGFYDAEGSSAIPARVSNVKEEYLSLYKRGLKIHGFEFVDEDYGAGTNHNVKSVRILGGIPESIRFKQITDIAIKSKLDVLGSCIKTDSDTRIVSIEDTGEDMEMVDITTTTENFVAYGCVAHNCFAPSVLHRDKEQFHSIVEPRKNIVEETRKQLERENITGRLIHLCFTCDPYPTGYDTTPTREIIKLLKEYGNHVQILTKGDGSRDFDLLDGEDWYGITLDGAGGQPYSEHTRVSDIYIAREHGIHTWVSFEPVVNARNVLDYIMCAGHLFDKVKIGKLNYHPSDINWKEFGKEAEALCQKLGLDYYIKDSLRKEMEK